eukprot:TRINITY_DN3623_c0_g1_i3.p1 TRINITY_DN3623_c0_g1~~TRINITY_DN3623_c0_g1_i3.p1  ORF type:complete len:151 (+),score=17.30 TRINITY_DN3623_c0_g1_i3:125-577(+)
MEPSRSEQIIKGLLLKPSKKPEFQSIPRPSVLSQVKSFIPLFKKSTEDLVKNPELGRMEVEGNTSHNQRVIEMNLGVGIFDVNNDSVEAIEQNIRQGEEVPQFVYISNTENKSNNPPIRKVKKKVAKRYTWKTQKRIDRANAIRNFYHPT